MFRSLDKLQVPLLLFMIINLVSARPSARALDGANEGDTQIFTERYDSFDSPDTPLCYGDEVDLMCYMMYSNGGYVQKNKLDCQWTCSMGVIKDQYSSRYSYYSQEGRYSVIPGWFCSVDAPALCNCSCKNPGDGKDKTAGIEVLTHGPPIIEIHDYMLPVEGDDFTINTTVTTDLPFKKRGCPRWKREKHQSQHRMQKTINCSLQENYTAFLELRIHNFSYANDAGNYTVTAGNACGVSSLPVSFGVDSAPAPDNPSGHGKQLLSRDEIIAISSVGSFFVILIIGFVVMSRRRNNKGVNLSMLSGGSGKNYGTMNRKAKKYRRIFHSIGPLFAENVKVDNLLPYLKQHDLVTNSEAAHLLHQTQSLAPLQINQLLLDCLAEKEIECLNLLLCSLNSEDEHLGHTDVAKELKQLMKTNDIEYEDICPVCNKAIN